MKGLETIDDEAYGTSARSTLSLLKKLNALSQKSSPNWRAACGRPTRIATPMLLCSVAPAPRSAWPDNATSLLRAQCSWSPSRQGA